MEVEIWEMLKTLSMASSECVFTLHLKPMIPSYVTQLTVRKSLHRNATVVIEARQVVMKIFEDYTQSWYWILMWVFPFMCFEKKPRRAVLLLTLSCLALSSGLVIAMVLSLLFIILLRFLAGIMVWVMVALLILVIGYGKSFKKMWIFWLLSATQLYYSLFKRRNKQKSMNHWDTWHQMASDACHFKVTITDFDLLASKQCSVDTVTLIDKFFSLLS